MIPQPTTHFGGKTSTKQVVPLPTASLLAYWDAGLTASYSGSDQQTWFDLSGNGYHLTLSGSGLAYVTSSGASIYAYSPAIDFNTGPFPGNSSYYIRTGSDVCDAFNPTSSGYLTLTSSLCSPGPLYLDNVDYTVLFYASASSVGGGLSIGDKLIIQQRTVPTDIRVAGQYEKTNPPGTTGGTIIADVTPSNNLDSWNLVVGTKICSGSAVFGRKDNSLIGYVYTNPYITPTTNIDNGTYPPGDKIANNKLSGTGPTSIGSDWSGLIQAVVVYNKVLSPTELQNAMDYFKFRKLN
jgi:hypothetical protein